MTISNGEIISNSHYNDDDDDKYKKKINQNIIIIIIIEVELRAKIIIINYHKMNHYRRNIFPLFVRNRFLSPFLTVNDVDLCHQSFFNNKKTFTLNSDFLIHQNCRNLQEKSCISN